MFSALFLDRDGVINVDNGYVHKIEDFIFIEDIFELISFANKLNIKVIVITNQSGIGRGKYTESDLNNLHEWMQKKLNEKNCFLDSIYYCPYHETFGLGNYKKDSDDRKPNPGMILKAQKDHNINLKESFLIGDKESDIIAGINAGIPNLIYFGEDNIKSKCKKIKKLKDALKIIKKIFL